MSLADSRTQNVERSRETSEVFDSVFHLLMDFANATKTIVPQPERKAAADDNTTDGAYVDEEEPRENEGDGNAGELFHILPGKDKEELVKDVFAEIVANMLEKLPEDGKETFLVRCFHGLFPKLPCRSQSRIEDKVNDVLSQSQEAFTAPSTPELPLASTNRISAGDLRPVTIRVNYPPAVGGGGGGGGGGGQGRGGGGGGGGRGRGQGGGNG